MSRNSINVSKTKKISGAGSNTKPNRKLFQKLSESSSLSSNRNSSAQSEDDERIDEVYGKSQSSHTPQNEDQDHITKKLQSQVKELRYKLRILEESADSKDYSIGAIAREKDRAIGEVKRLERSNKQLKQQLSDERNHYLEEKEKFCEEMTKYKRKLQDLKMFNDINNANSKYVSVTSSSKQSVINHQLKWQQNKERGDYSDNKMTGTEIKSSKSLKSTLKEQMLDPTDSLTQLRKPVSLESLHLYEGSDLTLQMAALRTENAKLRSIICERDERNYELCLRFLRMKHYKNDIKTRFQDLENEYLQVISNLMEKIDEARQEFNFIIDQKFKKPLHSTNAMYIQLVQRNSQMAFENASLRLENQCLKKELNKYVNGVLDIDTKIENITNVEKQESKIILGETQGGSKIKKMKKNVNFKEVKMIYDRGLAFKSSDTDSNYMSKTSTTVPSNGSLAEDKSSESMIICQSKNKPQPSFQVQNLPNEILNKIFKRVDTSSCQTLDSGRSKDVPNSSEQILKLENEGTKESKSKNVSDQVSRGRIQTSEKKKVKEGIRTLTNMEIPNKKTSTKESKPEIIETKKSSDSSSVFSKNSAHFNAKGNKEKPPSLPNEFVEVAKKMESVIDSEKEGHPRTRKQGESEKQHLRNREKFIARVSIPDKDCGDGVSSLELPVRTADLIGRNRLGKHEKIIPNSNSGDGSSSLEFPIRTADAVSKNRLGKHEKIVSNKNAGDGNGSFAVPVRPEEVIGRSRLGKNEKIIQSNQERNRLRTKHFKDSCGLQEKLEFSDLEANLAVIGTESKVQQSELVNNSRTTKLEKNSETNTRLSEQDSDNTHSKVKQKERRESKNAGQTRVGKTRNNTTIKTVNPHEQIVEATKNQLETDDSLWRRKLMGVAKIQQKPNRVEKNDSGLFKNLKCEPTESNLSINEPSGRQPEPDITKPRRPEGSKRFSHRLIATSPEQVRHFLVESQLEGSYRMPPITVGHASTEVNVGLTNPEVHQEAHQKIHQEKGQETQQEMHQDTNKSISVKYVTPTSTVGESSHFLSEIDMAESVTQEKETSISGLHTVRSSDFPVEISESDVRITVSDLPTSTSTVDVIDPALLNDRNSIMLRTLSAPGLLESNWLDPYNICEMRDCSTNT